MQNLPEPESSGSQSGDRVLVRKAQDLLADSGRRRGRLRGSLLFVGPAFIAAVAYIDPGNFATNIEAGSRFGYTLLWVILASNLAAMLLQLLSAKLGVASGLNLAEACRERFPRPVVLGMWVLMEIVVIATDLAEFLGAALGLHLLFGIPLGWAAIGAAVIVLLLLMLHGRSFRTMEWLIAGFVLFIAGCYFAEIVMALPEPLAMLGGLVPTLPSHDRIDALWLAAGILGATVMPHAIFLHSSLTQGRIPTTTDAEKKRLHRMQFLDVGLALPLAGLVNGAMLVTAAAAFHFRGRPEVASIETAYQALETSLGPYAKTAFGFALLASGLSSSLVGTMAGQVIMQGFLRRSIPVAVRRLVTMVPALVIIILGFDPTQSLVMSQVVLSLGLPFAVVPLLLFTNDKSLMGSLVNAPITNFFGWACAVAILLLNFFLVWGILRP